MSSQMIKQRKYRDISSEFLIELGKRLVKFRKSIAKTQIELATEYGKTHPATLGLWENGARPDPEYIKFLCDNYDANPGFFFLSEQFMFRQNNYLMPARIGAPRMSRDEYKSAVSAKINNLQRAAKPRRRNPHLKPANTRPPRMAQRPGMMRVKSSGMSNEISEKLSIEFPKTWKGWWRK